MIEIVVGVIAWALTVLGGIVWAYGAGQDSIIARQALEDRAALVIQETAASAAATAMARLQVHHTTITQEVRREIVERPVYRDCRHSADQLRRLNDAIAADPIGPAGGGSLPTPHRPGGHLRGDD